MVYITKIAENEVHQVELSRLGTSQCGSRINRVAETGQAVEMSVHRCSQFIAQNLERVFPDWVLPVTTCRVVVVLQQSRYPLTDTALHIEREKDIAFLRKMRYDLALGIGHWALGIGPRRALGIPHFFENRYRLRERFINFGSDVVRNLRDRGFLTDLIDPRTGYPQLSRPGEIAHDDTAVVKALLGFPIVDNSCSVLEHPSWGSAVYPGILMSSASEQVIKNVLKKVAVQLCWTEPKKLQVSVGV